MKNIIAILILLSTSVVWSQADSLSVSTKYSKITKHDGTEIVGIILKSDPREILLKTKSLGEVIIPKHTIKRIELIDDSEVKEDGAIWPRNLNASRYSITTNGFPVRKGEGYIRIMPIGVDFQFPITDNWSIGGMTSFYGVPLIVTSKISKALDDELNVSAGILYGNLLHGSSFSGDPFFSYGGGIGFGNLTFGTEEKNFNISGGYGFVHYPNFTNNLPSVTVSGTTMFSFAGMVRLEEKVMLVFDSMGLLSNGNIVYWANPAVRYMPKPSNIWQFGVNIAGYNSIVFPLPLPSVSFTQVFKK